MFETRGKDSFSVRWPHVCVPRFMACRELVVPIILPCKNRCTSRYKNVTNCDELQECPDLTKCLDTAKRKYRPGTNPTSPWNVLFRRRASCHHLIQRNFSLISFLNEMLFISQLFGPPLFNWRAWRVFAAQSPAICFRGITMGFFWTNYGGFTDRETGFSALKGCWFVPNNVQLGVANNRILPSVYLHCMLLPFLFSYHTLGLRRVT